MGFLKYLWVGSLSMALTPMAFTQTSAIEAKSPQRGSGIDFDPKEDPALERFTSDRWSRGLHLFAGLGLNAALYRHDERQKPFGIGLGATSAAGFALNPDWMIEITSNLGFRRDQTFFVWNSLFAPGVRVRLTRLNFTKNSALFGRGFLGWGMEVQFPHGVSQQTHYTGPVGGLGLGMMQGKAKQTVWFIELIAYLHIFARRYEVSSGSEAPEITSQSKTSGNAGLSLGLSAGILIF